MSKLDIARIGGSSELYGPFGELKVSCDWRTEEHAIGGWSCRVWRLDTEELAGL